MVMQNTSSLSAIFADRCELEQKVLSVILHRNNTSTINTKHKVFVNGIIHLELGHNVKLLSSK